MNNNQHHIIINQSFLLPRRHGKQVIKLMTVPRYNNNRLYVLAKKKHAPTLLPDHKSNIIDLGTTFHNHDSRFTSLDQIRSLVCSPWKNRNAVRCSIIIITMLLAYLVVPSFPTQPYQTNSIIIIVNFRSCRSKSALVSQDTRLYVPM